MGPYYDTAVTLCHDELRKAEERRLARLAQQPRSRPRLSAQGLAFLSAIGVTLIATAGLF